MHDDNPLPSFEGEPKLVSIPNDINEFTDMLWTNLNEENKVSLFVRYIDIATGEYLGIVSVATKMESESMFHANGKQYMHFNSKGSQIAELEYYVRFE